MGLTRSGRAAYLDDISGRLEVVLVVAGLKLWCCCFSWVGLLPAAWLVAWLELTVAGTDDTGIFTQSFLLGLVVVLGLEVSTHWAYFRFGVILATPYG